MRTAVAVLLLAAALVGCDKQTLIHKMVSADDDAAATQYITDLQRNDVGAIEKDIDATLRDEQLHSRLTQLAAYFPRGTPITKKLVGANTVVTSAGRTANLTYEFQYPQGYFLVNVATQTHDGARTIIGLNINPLAASLEELNRFTLTNKPAPNYLVLALIAVAVAVTLFALVSCIRTTFRGRKWPWVLFILFGVGRFAVNWTTGAWGVSVLSVQLFSASAFSAPYGPWVVAVSFPLGAIVYLARRRALIAPDEDEAQPAG